MSPLNQKGQVILFVIVALTVAMTVGVTVASRTISNLARTSRSDTADKVLAAAEAGVERYLSLTETELDAKAALTDYETVLLNPSGTDPIKTQARVKVSSFTANSPNGDYYSFTLGEDHVKEITFLNSSGTPVFTGNLDVCWKGNSTAIYALTYGTSGLTPQLIIPSSFSVSSENYRGSVSASATPRSPFTSCHTINVASGYNTGLRLRSLYGSSEMGVFASGLPSQGYKIISIGELVQEGKVKTTKKVTVYKSKSYLPAVFDTAIYTENDLN